MRNADEATPIVRNLEFSSALMRIVFCGIWRLVAAQSDYALNSHVIRYSGTRIYIDTDLLF